MRNKTALLVFGLGLLRAAAAMGAPAGDEESLLFGEEELAVTPARHSLAVSDAPASVTVITEGEIQASGAQTIAELLREVPGLEVFAAQTTDINVGTRGYNQTMANKLLVMIDGRSVYEDFFGFVVWDGLPVGLQEIKQIEVVRGPGSAVYGANAYGGVVHILTKSPREMAGTTFQIANGFEGKRREASLSHAGRAGGDVSYKSYLSWRESGFLGGQDRENPESVRGNFTLARPVGSRAELALSAGTVDGEGELQSGIGRVAYQNQTSYAGLSLESPGWQVRFYWRHSEDDTDNLDLVDEEGSPDERDILRNMWNLDLQLLRSGWMGTTWVLGGNARYQAIRSNFLDSWHDRTLFGLYGQVEKTLARSNDLTLGARVDHQSGTGHHVSPRVSIVHHFEGRKYLRLTGGEAYRNPTFIENYLDVPDVEVEGSPLRADAVGNEDLRPERVRSYEIAFGLPVRNEAFLRLEGFRNEHRDWVLFQPVGYYSEEEVSPYGLPGGVVPKTLSYANLYDVTCQGVEATMHVRWSPLWNTSVGYSYVQYEDEEKLPSEFTFVARHKLTGRVTAHPTGHLRMALSGHYRSDAAFSREGESLPGHATMDGAIQYSWDFQRIFFELAVQNAFDYRYVEYPGGDEFGRRLHVRLRYSL